MEDLNLPASSEDLPVDLPAVDKERVEILQTVQAGDASVHIRAIVPPDTRVKITVEAANGSAVSRKTIFMGDTVLPAPRQGFWKPFWSRVRVQGWLASLGWESILLSTALALYLATRLFQISNFPIYFFTDEAVQTVLASDLVRDGFYSYDHEFLPTYFYNGYQYNLSTSVYMQVLPYMLFGKSIALTRGLAALATLLAAASLGLIMQRIFKRPYAWAAVMLLSITPAWFLHSRTAFETSLGVTFFAVFLYCYLTYRAGSDRHLFLAVLSGALTFYSYSPARVVIGLTALALFFSDLRYHLQHWKTVLIGLGMALLFAVPLLRFTLQHPTYNLDHLRVLRSYWIQDLPFLDKVAAFLLQYLRGLDPRYWYFPNQHDLVRHLMKGYGHVLWLTLPFLLVGLVITARNIRKPAYRAVLIALLAAPAGAAVVALGITRALVMVIPLALLSAIGLSWLLEQAVKRAAWLRGWLPGAVFGLLCFVNLFMTWDALNNGPLWFDDYGLGGMQWGAKELFAEIADFQQQHPQDRLIVSPSWGNGTDTTARFFFPTPLPFQMGSIEGYFNEVKALDDSTLFVMIPSEYQSMLESGKFTDIRVEKVLSYPNGKPGFVFVQLRYVDEIEQILAAERAERLVLQEANVDRAGEQWAVRYSFLDMGSINDAFDGNPETLLRTMEANPMVVEIEFPSPKQIRSVQVRIGGPPTVVDLIFTSENGDTIPISRTVVEEPMPHDVLIELEEPILASRLRVEILSVRDAEPAHVHLWEISINQP